MASGKLLRHVVLFQFNDDASAKELGAVGAAFVALPAAIPEIHNLEWGAAVNDGAAYSHCLLVTCRNEDDLQTYSNHPAHKAVPEKFGSLVAGVVELDYWTAG